MGRPSITTERSISATASVVVGRGDDLHAAAVCEAVRELGGRVVLLDAESLSETDVLVDHEHVALASPAGELTDLQAARGWLRRLAPESWSRGAAAGSHDGVVRSAWVSALVSIARLGGVHWLSPLDVLFSAEDKLAQQLACRQLGILVPPMAFVTRADRIPEELGDWLVVKPMASGHFFDSSGAGRVVYATEMRRSDERLSLLSGAPFLVQRRVDAEAHLRVVTVREQSWVCELRATERPLDWRADESAHSSFHQALRPAISAQAVALADHFGLGYSSQDWIVDRNGEALFLDLNPAGQWLFLPDAVADAATVAIAEWLVGIQ